MTDAVEPGRRAQLNSIKLAALVRDHIDDHAATVEPSSYPGGAALRRGPAAWVLADAVPQRSLGAALAWALRSGAESLNLVAERSTGLLARRARGFSFPIEVFLAEGRALVVAEAEPLLVEPQVSDAHRRFEQVIVEAGAQVVHEHGVVAGEVDGLEVCRVVDDPALGETRLEVGVGAHDREAFLLMHGNRPTAEALADVVEVVRGHRRAILSGHPLSRLAVERLVRARLVTDPSLLGATALRPISPPVPRVNLKDTMPCAAVATIGADEVAVVCSVGVDLDVVPFTVDVMASAGLGRALVVVPPRDAVDLQLRLAALVALPVSVVSLPVT